MPGAPPVGPDLAPDPAGEPQIEDTKDEIETTVEELEGFQIVRAIIASEIPWDRIHPRDTKSYFGILIDDNNRKLVCRLHFNRRQKYLGLFDEAKVETRVPIDEVGDIYAHAQQLRETALRHD